MPYRPVVEAFLAALDSAAPGLVEGFYLSGSIALDAFRPGRSDIDFVGVLAASPSHAQLSALEAAYSRHKTLHPLPLLDGLFLTWNDLTAGPAALIDPRPVIHDGQFTLSASSGAHNPVTWHTLANHGLRCRGPELSTLNLPRDASALAAWTLANLDQYWSPLVAGSSARALDPSFTEWTVLGVCRLHYTIATGRITSKHGAGRYALDAFPRWHKIILEALSLDTTGRSTYSDPEARRSDCLAFANMVIADARRLGAA